MGEMDALESPFEALAVDYLTYGLLTAVNNIWAWAAVITAAVSFWRIRSTSSTSELSSAPPKVADGSAEPLPATVSSSESFRVLEREGSTKKKFSLYYEEEECFRGEDGGGEGEEYGGKTAAKWWCDDWEKVMMMRMGDMGWYRWQDTTALDGGVVRLWEGRRRSEAAVVVGGGR